jgi:hypothetical protein
MKEILLVFDGAHFSAGAFEFARHINRAEKALFTGVFLPPTVYANLWAYTASLLPDATIEVNTEGIEQNKKNFASLCLANNMQYRIHDNFLDLALAALRTETLFADLLIIGSESFYEQAGSNALNEYMEETLHNAGCAVVVVPEQYKLPTSNIIAYDGSDSSIYAIKQFSLLLPLFAGNKTVLVYAGRGETAVVPHEEQVKDLTARLFSNSSCTKLGKEEAPGLPEWLQRQEAALLVSGSFGRSAVSRLFRKSFISGVIKDHRIPVFIAHR